MSKVTILTDENGHFYIVGQDTLDQTRVRSKEHIDIVEKLLKKNSTEKSLLTVAGTYPVAEDRFLSAVRLQPDYVVLSSHPMPA